MKGEEERSKRDAEVNVITGERNALYDTRTLRS